MQHELLYPFQITRADYAIGILQTFHAYQMKLFIVSPNSVMQSKL